MLIACVYVPHHEDVWGTEGKVPHFTTKVPEPVNTEVSKERQLYVLGIKHLSKILYQTN
jgi:hypothetical protein